MNFVIVLFLDMEALRETLDEQEKGMDNSLPISASEDFSHSLNLQFENPNNPKNNFLTPNSTTELEPSIHVYKVNYNKFAILKYSDIYFVFKSYRYIKGDG